MAVKKRKTPAAPERSETAAAPIAKAVETAAAAAREVVSASSAIAKEAATETLSRPAESAIGTSKRVGTSKPESPHKADGAETYETYIAFGRDDVAALVRANAALVKGFEEIGEEVAGFARTSMVSAVDAARALVGVRTVADLVEINRSLAQTALESVIAKSARLSEIGIRTATEALGPLNERVVSTFAQRGRLF